MRYLKYLSDRFKSLRMMMNMAQLAKDDILRAILHSNILIGQRRSNDEVLRSIYVSPITFDGNEI